MTNCDLFLIFHLSCGYTKELTNLLFVLRLYVPVNNSLKSGRFPRVEPVLGNEDEVPCSRAQNSITGEIGTLPNKLTVLRSNEYPQPMFTRNQ